LVVDNDFKILYDNLNLLKINFEVFHTSSEKLDLLLSGNYYLYDLSEQDQAWNMPNWDANLSIDYKITEQLSVSADVFLIGTRKALIKETQFKSLSPASSVTNPTTYKSFNLDTAFDLNVRGNYKITEKFSVFAQLNNFGFQKYERWFGYPVQSFNFLAGVSYAF
jgi:outer membrane receptor for ferrienterochelin and colicin